MWWRRSWFSLKGKAGIPEQTEGRPATSIGPRVPPVGSLQQRGVRILDDHDVAPRVGGSTSPVQRRGYVLAIPRVLGRDGLAVLESGALDDEGHALPPPPCVRDEQSGSRRPRFHARDNAYETSSVLLPFPSPAEAVRLRCSVPRPPKWCEAGAVCGRDHGSLRRRPRKWSRGRDNLRCGPHDSRLLRILCT